MPSSLASRSHFVGRQSRLLIPEANPEGVAKLRVEGATALDGSDFQGIDDCALGTTLKRLILWLLKKLRTISSDAWLSR